MGKQFRAVAILVAMVGSSVSALPSYAANNSLYSFTHQYQNDHIIKKVIKNGTSYLWDYSPKTEGYKDLKNRQKDIKKILQQHAKQYYHNHDFYQCLVDAACKNAKDSNGYVTTGHNTQGYYLKAKSIDYHGKDYVLQVYNDGRISENNHIITKAEATRSF